MSIATIIAIDGAHDILGGQLNAPIRGPWIARIELDADAPFPTGTATIVLARDGGGAPASYVGTITHASTWQGRAKAVVMGGAGRLLGELAPTIRSRNYEPSPFPIKVSTIVEDIASDAGETLAAGVSDALGALIVPRWLRAAGTPATALDALARVLGLGWRTLADGTLWVGVETWPAATDVAGLYQQNDDGGPGVIDAAQAASTLVPGTTVLGQQIREVVYQVADARCELYYGPNPVELFTQAVQSNAIPLVYRETHAATVRSQNSDDTVDLEVDDQRIKQIAKVPLRVGLPGARVLVDEGLRVRLGFEDGDPSKPYATGIDADPTASAGVARVGDACGYLYAQLGATGIAALYYSPTQAPSANWSGVPMATAPPTPVTPGAPIQIQTGSAKVMLQ